MLNLHQKTFDHIKRLLLRQQRQLEKNLKSIDADDPLKSGDSIAESSEPGTDSWLAEVHRKTMALKQNLLSLLSRTKYSLANLKLGKYGKCERCGKQIEAERLLAMPTATLCLACSKQTPKKSNNNVRH